MLPNLHIFGVQGSGKDTQAARLAGHFNLVHLSSGALFRARAEIDDAFASFIKEGLDNGQLLPDEFLYQVVGTALEALPQGQGIIGAGIIRTAGQLTGLTPYWQKHQLSEPFAIELKISDQKALERALSRQRSDDTVEVLSERIKQYHDATEPLIEIFATKQRLISVDADRPVEDITSGLITLLQEHVAELHGTH